MTTETLPRRVGPPPRTYQGPPHTQLDQQPDARIRAQFGRRFGGFPGVDEQPTGVRFVPGARALCLAPDVKAGPPEAFITGREFAHLHALPDSSLHVVLPEPLARQAIDAGWGELHPQAGTAVPATTLLVYAPRDPVEIDVVLDLVRRSSEFARGDDERPALTMIRPHRR